MAAAASRSYPVGSWLRFDGVTLMFPFPSMRPPVIARSPHAPAGNPLLAATPVCVRGGQSPIPVVKHLPEGDPAMNVVKKTLLLVLSSAFLVGGLGACERTGETPGEKLDRALDNTGDKVKEAGEAIKTK